MTKKRRRKRRKKEEKKKEEEKDEKEEEKEEEEAEKATGNHPAENNFFSESENDWHQPIFDATCAMPDTSTTLNALLVPHLRFLQ